MTITGIPSGQQVVLSNLAFNFWWSPGAQSGVSISGCAGSVLLEDIYFLSRGQIGSVLSIQQCQNVVLRGNEYALGGVPLTIVNSTVLLSTCLLRSDPPSTLWPSLAYTNACPALDVRNSDVTVVGSGLYGYTLNPTWGPFQPAVRLDNSTLRVGPATIMRGATLSSGNYSLAYQSVNPATCQVHIDPRAQVNQIGPGSQPQPTTTAIDATYHSWIVAGYPFGLSVVGPANGFALMLLGNLLPVPTPTPFGPTVLDPLTAQIVDLVFLPPPYGNVNWTLPCPATAPVATPFVFQALTLSPSGQFGITIPSPLTVGWQHGRIP
ncbi:MAG TPA: hypothetical protein VF384_14700 [Planctomycetota bacterium]